MMKSKYMYLICSIVIGIGLWPFFISNNNKILDLIKASIGKEVRFPNTLKPLNPNSVIDIYKPHVLVYFSSEICTICNINKINDWDNLEKELNKAQFVYILSIKEDEKQQVLEELNELNVEQKVIYIDSDNYFEKQNPFVGANQVLHVWGVNKQGVVEVVGDPLYNKEIRKLYMSIYAS